jgi:hypothetical protein
MNYKIVDLVESYNFYIKFTTIRLHTKKLQFFEKKLTPIVISYNGCRCYSIRHAVLFTTAMWYDVWHQWYSFAKLEKWYIFLKNRRKEYIKINKFPTTWVPWFFIFLIILQNYTTVWKFIKFDHQPSWATAVAGPTAIAHGGWANAHGPHGREGQPLWTTTVEAYSPCATAAGLTAVGHGGRVVQPLWPTAAGQLPPVRAENYPKMS